MDAPDDEVSQPADVRPFNPDAPELHDRVPAGKHATSREALDESNATGRRVSQARRIHGLIAFSGNAGMTTDEVEAATGLPHQTASARMYDLVRAGAIVRTETTRETRHGATAAVFRKPATRSRRWTVAQLEAEASAWRLRLAAYHVIAARALEGRTDDELSAVLGLPLPQSRAIRSWLEHRGLVVDSGRVRRITAPPAGRAHPDDGPDLVVWLAVDAD